MDLRTELINAAREGLQAADKAAGELNRIKGFYKMTPDGVQEQADRLFKEARTVADAAKARGLAAIDNKIAELDAQEKAEGQRRAGDLAYMQRLSEKLKIAQNMGEISPEDRDKVKDLFAEFAGDSLSVAVIRNTLGGEKAFFFLPEDNTGKRQEHIKGTVKTLFIKAMDEAGADPAAFTSNPDARAAEVNAFCEYCRRQDADFSRPDREVWQELYNARREAAALDAVKFDLRMMGL